MRKKKKKKKEVAICPSCVVKMQRVVRCSLDAVESRVVQGAPCWTAESRGVHASKARTACGNNFLFSPTSQSSPTSFGLGAGCGRGAVAALTSILRIVEASPAVGICFLAGLCGQASEIPRSIALAKTRVPEQLPAFSVRLGVETCGFVLVQGSISLGGVRGCSTMAKPGMASSAAGEVCGISCLVPSRGKDRPSNEAAGHYARARVVQFLVAAANVFSFF
ncbi:hypothetical protein IWX90DRAFT_72461 [Phyllosticta citrichinensis]|uniref:Uncharacterized protein n=1 Tax=Phyllosticta citrichinensis TaxID=1130410 RepID=A0ABR1XGE2_9PEZI